MPKYESHNRIGWRDELYEFVNSIMLEMSVQVDLWAQNIIDRNNAIIDNIDEKIQDAKDAILVDKAMRENIHKEEKKLNNLVVEANSKMKKCNNNAAKFKVNANKYQIEKDNLEKLKPGTSAYKEQEKRLKKFEPDYKRWVKLTEEAEDWLKKSQKYKTMWLKFNNKYPDILKNDEEEKTNAGGTVTHLNSVLENLLKDKELLENSSVKNMDKHRDELIEIFRNSENIRITELKIFKTIDRILGGSMKFNYEFSESEKFKIVEILISDFSLEKEAFNCFKVFAKDAKNYTEVNINGKLVKVFDMDKIPMKDVSKNFSNWFASHIKHTTLNAIKKFNESCRFVPEQQNNRNNDDDDETFSLYEREDAIDQSPYGNKLDDTKLKNSSGVQYDFSETMNYLKSHLGNLTKLVNESLQRQLPEKAYFRRIGESKAANELRNVIKKCIDAIGSDFRNGFDCFHRLKDFIKTYTGGVYDMNEFNIIYTVIRAALEFEIASKIGKDILDRAKSLRKDEVLNWKRSLMVVKEKQEISKSALRNVDSVRYAKRILKIARNLVEESW